MEEEQHTSRVERHTEGRLDALERELDELLKLFTGKGRVDVNLVGQALDVEHGLGVGREHLLELLNGNTEAEECLGLGVDVNLMLGLDLLCKVLRQVFVKLATTEVSVESSGLDHSLFLGEGGDRDSHGAMADIDKNDVAVFFFQSFFFLFFLEWLSYRGSVSGSSLTRVIP